MAVDFSKTIEALRDSLKQESDYNKLVEYRKVMGSLSTEDLVTFLSSEYRKEVAKICNELAKIPYEVSKTVPRYNKINNN